MFYLKLIISILFKKKKTFFKWIINRFLNIFFICSFQEVDWIWDKCIATHRRRRKVIILNFRLFQGKRKSCCFPSWALLLLLLVVVCCNHQSLSNELEALKKSSVSFFFFFTYHLAPLEKYLSNPNELIALRWILFYIRREWWVKDATFRVLQNHFRKTRKKFFTTINKKDVIS